MRLKLLLRLQTSDRQTTASSFARQFQALSTTRIHNMIGMYSSMQGLLADYYYLYFNFLFFLHHLQCKYKYGRRSHNIANYYSRPLYHCHYHYSWITFFISKDGHNLLSSTIALRQQHMIYDYYDDILYFNNTMIMMADWGDASSLLVFFFLSLHSCAL